MSTPAALPNDFVTKSVQQLHRCPVLFLGSEMVRVASPQVPHDVEVRAYCLITATAAQRCFAWLDPLAPIVEPRVVCVMAHSPASKGSDAVKAWLVNMRRAA